MIFKSIKSLTNTYNNLSNWGKILIFIVLLLFVVVIFKSFKINKEGFEQNDEFLIKTDIEVYDSFYSNIYDYLVYNNVKNDYEIGEIINKTEPTSESLILDVGSGTGHHVATLETIGFNTVGIDKSADMVAKAKSTYPQLKFVQGDVLNSSQFSNNSFTHILCLYFTLYYIKDKSTFFSNCYQWLKPGGYLVVHVVNRELFDPILPPGNPLLMVSPQKYAKQRINTTQITFDQFHYSSEFDLKPNDNIAYFNEKFKFTDNGKVRKNQHILYMDTESDIITKAQNVGFIVEGKIDLLFCQYEYQYLYILTKPT